MNFSNKELSVLSYKLRHSCTFIILLYLLFNFQSTTLSQPNFEWEGSFPNDTTGVHDGVAFPLAIDDAGNVIIGGSVGYLNGYVCFATVKYSSSGFQQWASTYFGQNTGGRGVFDLALDNNGNVFITGKTWTSGQNFNWCTIKYSAAGVQEWVQIYDDSLNGEDLSEKIGVDNAGNIYVSGYCEIASGGGLSFVTIKYSTDGRQLWVRKYPVPTGDAYVNGLLIDDSCNIYITGEHTGRALTIKYDSSGTDLWRQLGPGFPNGFATSNSMALDRFHNVYIAGENAANYRVNYFTIKYSTSGVQQWMREFNIDTTQPSWNIGNCIVVDSSDNIYVNGSTWLNASDPMKYCTIKYSNSGNLLWVRRDSTHLAGQDTYMAIDRDGFVYVGGEGCPVAVGRCQDDRQTVIKYDSSGNKQWQISGNRSQFHNFLLDKNFNIYITSGGNKLFIEKYSQLVGVKSRNSRVPNIFKLFQNYPNPFNPSTIINYTIPKSGFVKLSIYNVLGQLMKTIVNENEEAGYHTVRFEAANLSSGIYFYRMDSGDYREIKKMTICK